MDVVIKNVNDVTVATLSGELDGSVAPVVQQKVLSEAGSAQRLVLDLTAVPYMSSAGLRMLLSTYRQITGNGGRIVLQGVSPQIRDTMSVTGFLKFFTLADTFDDAVASLL